MKINLGWFAKLTEIAPLASAVSGLDSEGASIAATIAVGDYDGLRIFGNGPSTYVGVNFAGNDVDVLKSGSTAAKMFNLGLNDGEPHSIEIVSGANPDTGNPGYQFIIDDVSRGWEDSSNGVNGFWTINAILSNASAGKNGRVSRVVVKSDPDTVVLDLDSNRVLNANGDGFVLRSLANANSTIAESNFNGKLYDVTSANGNHITLPGGTTWEYISNFSLPSTITAGSIENFTAPGGFNVDGVKLGTYTLPFSFSSPPEGSFNPPNMGDVAGFLKFGMQQIQLIDSSAGLTAEQEADWRPSGNYDYVTLTKAPSTTDRDSICYAWTNPLVAGNQVVFDPNYLTVNEFGGISFVTTSKTFLTKYYIIDDNGMQESVITQDSTGVVIPTLSIDKPGLVPINEPTVINCTATNAASYFWEVLSKPQGATITFKDPTAKNVEVAGDLSGAVTLRVTGFNAEGNGSANDTVTFNFGQQSSITVTIFGITDGSHSIVLHRRDTNEKVFKGNATFSNGEATLTINGVAANEELYGVWFGDNPPLTGTGTYGVTE